MQGKECDVIYRLCKDVRELLSHWDILDVYVSVWVVKIPHSASEVMILDGDMFCPGSELDGLGHGNS